MKKLVPILFIGMTAMFLSACGGVSEFVSAILAEDRFDSGVHYSIPDNDPRGISSPIAGVSDVISLERIDVSISVTHPRLGDLRFYLESPRGTRVKLSENNGGDAFVSSLYFDDGEDKSITDAESPLQLRYAPEASMSAFNDENPNGTWTLIVSDTVSGNAGSINNWHMLLFGTK